jgi:hypothetical protein
MHRARAGRMRIIARVECCRFCGNAIREGPDLPEGFRRAERLNFKLVHYPDGDRGRRCETSSRGTCCEHCSQTFRAMLQPLIDWIDEKEIGR